MAILKGQGAEGDMSTKASLPIKPIYNPEEHGGEIELATETVEYSQDNQTYSRPAKVFMRFTPRPRLEFRVNLDGPMEILKFTAGNIAQPEELRFPDRGVSVNVHWAFLGYNGVVFTPTREPIQWSDNSEELQKVNFHVVNFPEFQSTCRQRVEDGKRVSGINSLVLEHSPWRVSISELSSIGDVYKTLRASGYAITHAGQLERIDGQSFPSSGAEKIDWAIKNFLSFCAGCWIGITLPVGFDADGNRVWEQLGCGRCDQWKTRESWFAPLHGDALSDLFPGFMRLWESETWKRPLEETLYWYCLANDPMNGLETGVISAQIAMERIAWTLLVNDKGAIEPKGYKALWASDRFRLLFSFLDIPKEIPDSLEKLKKTAKQLGWSDGLHAFTEIRNSIIHPEKKNRHNIHNCFFEAWRLGLWYLDLLILRLCEYDGKYANRWSGDVVRVPWRTPLGEM